MPKRNDINKIVIIGSGPIVIGQGCEFDYSGTQACKILREEGYDVILINSNPATIMTDFEVANTTYIEPVNLDIVVEVIKKENPDAILPTFGGQSALNIVSALSENGILDQFKVEIIGVTLSSIYKAESRAKFKKSMIKIGLKVTKSGIVSSLDEAIILADKIGFPLIVRASFTMGGSGSSIVNNLKDLKNSVISSLSISPVSEIILEESIVGWKEYELELMRDLNDNVVVICSIENIDPIGIHTGDSMAVSPVQTLTDKEYQIMRDSAIKVMQEIGVKNGGANVQFAVNSKTGEMLVIEMNPRVSRSSALASKATGFPIAKIATKLAVGYTLDEIRNDITGKTMACFEPSIDYCVVKIPVWDSDRFNESKSVLTTMMKSVGETMAIGRTFKEAMQKAIRSLGMNIHGFGSTMLDGLGLYKITDIKEKILKRLFLANSLRLLDIYYAFKLGINIEEISNSTGIDPWFIFQLHQIFETEKSILKTFNNNNFNKIIIKQKIKNKYKDFFIKIKSMGFSDAQIAALIRLDEIHIRKIRQMIGIKPVYKAVDTCSAEFDATSPYYYSTYESECEVKISKFEKKVIVLGSGPNRIGQGIEFDYCCVHASLALREEGIKSIMINSNPSTVSTDYDISDRLYFEPLTYEDVMNIVDMEKPSGIIVQFGGQIPLNIAKSLEKSGVLILGTQPLSIHRAEDRGLFKEILDKLNLKYPKSFVVKSVNQAIAAVKRIGYPVVLRPSFILGGRAISIVRNDTSLIKFTKRALSISGDYPILIDEFLSDAIEIDVDLISDGSISIICGIMEHIEEAGIHSGDSTCVLPPRSINFSMLAEIKSVSKRIALELNIVGLMNIQYAIKNNILYVLEVNPRASRTIPFVSKATGISFAKIATKVMLGNSLLELNLTKEINLNYVAVKESIFPFDRFLYSDMLLGATMKSTGEVMGIGLNFELAYFKAQMAAGYYLPLSGTVFLGYYKKDKIVLNYLVNRFKELGFSILLENYSDRIEYFINKGVRKILKPSPLIIKDIENGKIQLVVTIENENDSYDFAYNIRRVALKSRVLYVTTFSGALALCDALSFLLNNRKIEVRSIQSYYKNN